MTFLQPAYFNLFFLLALLAPLWLYHLWTKSRGRRRLGAGRPLRRISELSSTGRECARYLLLNLALGSLILALAHPQIVRETTTGQPKRMDIVFLLDTSPSMRAQDIPPTRLERAIEVIRGFSEKKPPDDRVALVSFSGGSLILSYLTRDPENLPYYLNYLREDSSLRFGTNIGQALKNGVDILRKEAEVDPKTRRHKKVFVLISDGEDHGAVLESGLLEVKKEQVAVHAIGIGSEEGAPIPVPGENGDAGYLEDEAGNRIMTHFNEKTLRSIAEQTGGRFYRALTGQELEGIFQHIAVREREIETFRKTAVRHDVYRSFLLAALVFFMAAVLIESARPWKKAPA
jgi:Ca-activated chloride channel family protein